MKMTTLKSVAIAVGLASPAFGQATSPVVGYETLALQPNDAFNLVGFRLHGKVVASGTFDSSTATSLTDSGATYTLDSGTAYIAEYADGSSVEFLGSDFSSGTISGLTGITSGFEAAYEIREANTLDSVFGALNTSGLASSTSGAVSEADVIWVPNEGGSGFTQYYHVNISGFEGWYDTTSLTSPVGATTVIPAGTGVFIQTQASTSVVELVVSGAVKTTPASISVDRAFSLIGGVFPVGQTLDESGLENFVNASTSGAVSEADVLWLPTNGVAPFTQYYYVDISGFEGWYDTTSLTSPVGDTVELTPGFYIQKQAGSANYVASIAPANIYLSL